MNNAFRKAFVLTNFNCFVCMTNRDCIEATIWLHNVGFTQFLIVKDHKTNIAYSSFDNACFADCSRVAEVDFLRFCNFFIYPIWL